MYEQAHFPVYAKPHKEFDCGNLLICELFSLCFSWRLKDLNLSCTGMDVDQSVSLAFSSELSIINTVLADQRAVCCYKWPDREALPSDQLWLKLKPGFNPWPFTSQTVPFRRSSCLPWVTSRSALLDVMARQFRLFVHKSLCVWLLGASLQSEDIIYKYSFTHAVVTVGYANLCWHTCHSWAEGQILVWDGSGRIFDIFFWFQISCRLIYLLYICLPLHQKRKE